MTAPARVIAAAAARYGISSEQLLSQERKEKHARARKVAARVMFLGGFSYYAICRHLNRSETAVRGFCKEAATEPRLRANVESVCTELSIRTSPVDVPVLSLLRAGDEYVSVVRERDGSDTGVIRRVAEVDGVRVQFPERPDRPDLLLPLTALRGLGL